MLMFFSAVGISAGEAFDHSHNMAVFMFVVVMVVIHWVFLLLFGKFVLGQPSEVLLLASNALAGGPATAVGRLTLCLHSFVPS
jgi:hypothetical protein